MHRKVKGNIGQSAIVNDLLKKEYTIFLEFGDLSRIDLIAEKNGKLTKIQIKSITANKEGAISLKPIKSGPNYKFKYSEGDVDIFAAYCLDTEEIGYINSTELLKYKNSMSLRIRKPKNNQKTKIRYLSEYRDIEKAINN